MPDDTNKVKELNKWGGGILASFPEHSAKLSKTSIRLARQLNYSRGLASALNNLGKYHLSKGDYNQALELFEECLEVCEDLNFELGISGSLTNIGVTYKEKGDYKNAVEFYLRNLKRQESTGNLGGVARMYHNIGTVNYELKDYEIALRNFQISDSIRRNIGDSLGIADLQINIGSVYQIQDSATAALEEFQEALQIYTALGNRFGIANARGLMGQSHLKLRDFDTAIDEISAALKIDTELGNKGGITEGLLNLGIAYDSTRNNLKALEYYERAYAASIEFGQRKSIVLSAKYLGNAYARQGRYKDAFKMISVHAVHADTMNDENGKREVVARELEYAFDKQTEIDSIQNASEKQLIESQLKEQRAINVAVIVGLSLMTILAILLFVFFKNKQRANKTISNEKKRSEALLLNILPEETAEELKEFGYARPQSYEQVTVLFTDFKGFTAIAEQLSPEELVEEIDHCFRAFDEIVTKHGVEKIKTIGDAYMCVGGLPTKNQTHPIDVVNAALEMRDWMDKHAAEQEAKGKPSFQVRIGVHTGPVVAGIVGTKKFAYDIWGDTVNTASRMESSGEPGKVNISGDTWKLVQTKFHSDYRGKVAAKNKGEIDMYFIER